MNLPRRIVIPDIHGCACTFASLVRDQVRLQRHDTLYLLGDYIDRGPRSREVLEFIMELQRSGYRVRPIRGNHEEMLLTACNDRSRFRVWMLNGGKETLRSFSAEDACEIPLAYRRFLQDLPYYHQLHDFILVHAALNLSIADPFSDTETMLWSRDMTDGDRGGIGARRVVCGHTPRTLGDITRSLTSDRIFLDNGCVYNLQPGFGCLVALDLDSLDLHLQINID